MALFAAALISFAMIWHGGTALAGQTAPSTRADAAAIEAEHRRLVAEQLDRMAAHQRALRAGPPPARPDSPPPGIVQLPIDLGRPRPSAKPDDRPGAPRPPGPETAAPAEPAGAVARTASTPPPPPPCPTALPYPNPGNAMPPLRTASIVKTFPEISWHICVTDMGPRGLWIGPVELLRFPADGWRTILYQAGLADLFVPYHNNPAARYYDMGGPPNRALDPISLQDVGGGSRIWLTNEAFPTVAYELRERGIGWLCKGDTQNARRAQELVLWAVSDAGNYDNIIEYGFRDDGAITFRTGNTGYNSPPAVVEPHTHDSFWYVDMDLNGFAGDSAFMLRHDEPYTTANPLLALDQQQPIATEGGRQFHPYAYLATLLIEDSAVDLLQRHMGYEFSPIESIPTRHMGSDETWTLNDFYVTRYHYADSLWASPLANHVSPDSYLLPALNNEPTANRDLVVWIKTSVHHHPNAEDLGTNAGSGIYPGVTLTHWSGFKIEPHNLFRANPLGEPVRCGL